MTVGFAPAYATALIDQLIADGDFIQLHDGDPGAAGTANVAGNATRKDISGAFAAAAAAGGVASATSDVSVDWNDSEVDTTETYTHFSMWSAVTGGTFRASGTVSANAVNASGDTFSIAPGGLVLSLPTAA